jgi:uncharacterized membrane protein (DUF485 family)
MDGELPGGPAGRQAPPLAGRPAPGPAGRPASGPIRSLAWGPGQVSPPGGQGDAAQPDRDYWQILVRSLIRAQLGLSLVCLAFALAVTASFPIVWALLPSAIHITILGLPLTLIALGIGVFPVILIIGAFYVRQATRLERQFTKLAERVDGAAADD